MLTTRRGLLLALLLIAMTTLHLTDGHSPQAALTLGLAYTLTALGVGLGAALLLDRALHLGDKRTRAQRREDDTFLALADSIQPGWRD